MARTLTLAAIQFTPSDDMQDNIARVAGFIRDAAAKGADVVLPPELFCGHYFCKTQEEEHFARAMEWTDHPPFVSSRSLPLNSASSSLSRSTRRMARSISILS